MSQQDYPHSCLREATSHGCLLTGTHPLYLGIRRIVHILTLVKEQT
jgi:hypothetical protein